jgi:hypothetical protein
VLDGLGLVPAYARRAAPPDWRIAELLTYAGVVPLALGVLAAISPRDARRRRDAAAWALVVILAAVLSLGPVLKVGGEVVSFAVADVGGSVDVTVALPYALLAKLPLLSLNRAPARINTTLMLALAVLAAHGLTWLMACIPGRWRTAVAVALSLLTLVELLVVWPFPTTPVHTPAYLEEIAKSGDEGAVLNVPIGAGHVKQLSIFQQTIHEHPVYDSWFQRALPVFPDVAGFLDGLLAPETEQDIVPAPTTADRAATARAQGLGYVFLHTPYVGHAEAKMALLEATFGPPESVAGDIVIYKVAPGPETPQGLVYALPNNDWSSPKRGWQYTEVWNGQPARWMPASVELYIHSPSRQEGVLQFTALPFAEPQRLQIEVNQAPLPPLVIGEWTTYTTPVFTLQSGLNQVTLRALNGCRRFVGDPRCGGVTLAVSDAGPSECAPHLDYERCLGALFQNVRFRAAADGPASVPLDEILGGQVRLLGYDLAGSMVPGAASPGTPLSLTLYWQAVRSPGKDYTVFVHLLGTDGSLLAQHDAPPLLGIYPTSRWVPGDVFTQRIDLPVPVDAQPGTYELLVGMYTYPDVVRLPVASDRPHAQDGLVWLQSVEIP